MNGHGSCRIRDVDRRLRRARRAHAACTSPTTPTMVISGSSMEKRSPIGLRPGQKRCAADGADHGDQRTSFAVGLLEHAAAQQLNAHRAEVVGRRGAVVRRRLRVRRQSRECVRPRVLLPGSSGRRLIAPATSTPGTCRSDSSARSQNSAFCAGVGYRAGGRLTLERQHVIGIEAGRLALQFDEAANRQAGTDEQHQRQRDLRRDERAAHPPLPDAAGAARTLLQIVVHVEARAADAPARGRRTGRPASRRRGRTQDARVDRHRAGDAEVGRAER